MIVNLPWYEKELSRLLGIAIDALLRDTILTKYFGYDLF